jgi:glycine dehydrogenase subunit 2
VVALNDGTYHLDSDRPLSCGKIREYWGNVPQIIKAYAWARSMGAEGLAEASDISVLANNYMDHQLARIKGVSRSHPHLTGWRMEMTRHSLEQLRQDTGVTCLDVQNRMVDYGVDAYWLSHEPWVVPEPFTPEAGEMYSKEDLDYWIAVIARVCEEAYVDPQLVKTAPHNQPIHALKSESLEQPEGWAMTWRAWCRKRAHRWLPPT